MPKQQDPIKWIIWTIIFLGLIWSLFFVKNGPQFVVDGIRLGSILMLGAIGLSLTYKILNFANFAHGDILIFGAYISFWTNWEIFNWMSASFPDMDGDTLRWIAISLAIILGIIGAIAISIFIDRILYRRMRRSAAVVLVIASFGVALFVRNLVQAIWGVGNRNFAMRIKPPNFYALGDLNGDGSWQFFIGSRNELRDIVGSFDFSSFLAIRFTTIQLVTVIVAFILVILLHLFLKFTKTGKAMRAMSDNSDLAQVSGINTERMISWTWAIGAGLSAIAGVFMGINFGIITPNTGAQVLLPLFAAVILGGIGSPYGAMLGALLIGIAQTVLVAPVIPQISSQYKPGIAFLLMILMLLIRPQGLLGKAQRKG